MCSVLFCLDLCTISVLNGLFNIIWSNSRVHGELWHRMWVATLAQWMMSSQQEPHWDPVADHNIVILLNGNSNRTWTGAAASVVWNTVQEKIKSAKTAIQKMYFWVWAFIAPYIMSQHLHHFHHHQTQTASSLTLLYQFRINLTGKVCWHLA